MPGVRRGVRALSVVAVAVAAGVVVGSPAVGLVALALTATGLRARTRARRERSAVAERECVAELLGGLALELGSGRSPAAALLAAAAPLAPPLPAAVAGAVRAARTSGDVPHALDGGAPALRALAAAWRVTARTGAPLAAAVDRLADGVRAESAAGRELDAALAGARSSARLLAGLPLLGLLLAAGLGAHPVHVLAHTPLGAACLLVGTALELAGTAWTAALVRGARRAA